MDAVEIVIIIFENMLSVSDDKNHVKLRLNPGVFLLIYLNYGIV